MKTYAVSWSYPGSPNAIKFGFTKTGCWTVSHVAGVCAIPKPLAGFATELEATFYKDGMRAKMDGSTMRNPEFL